jgi:hypothetical protein
MLHQRDYVMRLIEQMGSALVQLVRKIPDAPSDDLASIEGELEALARQVGMDLQLARRLDFDSLHLLITSAGDLDPARCRFLAELLYLHGLQAERGGRPHVAAGDFARALYLYRLVEPSWPAVAGLPAAEPRVQQLEAWLHGDG